MTQNEKDLLLKDLCARLPYGVKIKLGENPEVFDLGYRIRFAVMYGDPDKLEDILDITNIKPYLFPLSSMTEEQRIELYKALGLGYESHYHLSKEWEDFNDSIDNNDLFIPASWVSDINKMYNWLNKNHFDYRRFIPMGLANDATGLNIY